MTYLNGDEYWIAKDTKQDKVTVIKTRYIKGERYYLDFGSIGFFPMGKFCVYERISKIEMPEEKE